jgi:guanylate kinase
MKKRLILIGKAASGKDYFQKRLVDEGWIPLRQYTTRPKRPTEVGDEYHFVTEEEFDNISHKLVSVQNFNGWKYGFDMDEALKSDVMIFSPANFFNMVYDFDIKNLELSISSTVIYLDIDEYTRRERLSVRYVGGSEDDSLERRLRADADDFEFFDNIDGDEYQKNIQVPWVNLPKFVRLHNKEEVDDFLEKLLS